MAEEHNGLGLDRQAQGGLGVVQGEEMRLRPLPPLPDKPLVSVITSNLNHGRYLEETILSVLRQDYEPIELIIVDGSSQDNTLEVLRKYEKDPRVRWISEPDSGHMAAINKGLRLATGEIIGVLHSTDTYQPGAIREAVQQFASDPLVAFVGGSLEMIDVQGRPTGAVCRLPSDRPVISIEEIVGFVHYPGIQASFFRRDLGLAIGGFHDDPSCHTNTFLHLMLEASRIGMHSLRVPDVWGRFRDHPDHDNMRLRRLGKGVLYARKRTLTCTRMAQQYKGYLSPEQLQLLRRAGYQFELKRRVVMRHQGVQAIPTLMLYLWFGGHLPPLKKVWAILVNDVVLGSLRRPLSLIWRVLRMIRSRFFRVPSRESPVDTTR